MKDSDCSKDKYIAEVTREAGEEWREDLHEEQSSLKKKLSSLAIGMANLAFLKNEWYDKAVINGIHQELRV